jgi:type I restriction enzyme R subunit
VTPPTAQAWNEENLAELPAVELLQRLGYAYVAPDAIEADRGSLKDAVATKRLAVALKKLNPWLNDDNVNKAVRAVANVQAASVIEANEKLYTTLTYGMAVEQDRGDGQGRRNHSIRFFDFENPDANDFVVTRQYRVQAAKGHHIKPDVVLLVNGIPVVVIECKSPTLGEKWFEEAFDQVDRYQELRGEYRELGAPKLFEAVQAIVLTCGQGAKYGTVGTPQRFYAEWKSTYPVGDVEVTRQLGRKPTKQDVLFCGMLLPSNLLDLIRNFVVFEADPTSGRTVRKLCRYQQFAAVNKAIARAKTAKRPTERGGVVWHTQGSGKSLTMLWLALKLRRESAFGNPTLVIVTDRRDLDEQITATFQHCGFPNPERADRVRDLHALLKHPAGKTIMTTVQKFQELAPAAEKQDPKKRRAARESFPTLSTDANIFVLADEAHRTQYGGLAANLRQALPNACFLGFTGTPIDKKDRSTLHTFGPYIDTYTIEQAVKDGATVNIFYESRLPEVRIVGQTLDQLFERVFADRSDEERAAIKKKYATEAAIAEAPKRIETICLDLIDHYTKYIQPNGFKAQVVATSRDAAVTYKETLDRLLAPQSAVIMSTSHNDEQRLVAHATSPEERKRLIERFCKKDDPLSILVVCDMLLTGFDAPVEQVMYLDSRLREHGLLQAIARVNRVATGKEYGLIVDYYGVSDELQEALAIFSPSDIEGAMQPKVDELPRLQARHAAAMNFFARVKDKNDLDQCVDAIEAEDVRAEFNAAFRAFSQSLDMLLPDPRAMRYRDDMRWLGKIRAAAASRYRDEKLDISDCGAKVRKLIEEAIVADGIQVLVAKVPLFSKEFEKKLEATKSDEARASTMEHAIRHEIHVKLDENPVFYQSLRQRLEEIIADRKVERITAAEQLKLLDKLMGEMKGVSEAASDMGLTDTGFAIYGLLQRELAPVKAAEPTVAYNESTKELASLLDEAIEPHTAIIDWTQKAEVQKEMRKQVKRQLRAAQVDAEKAERLAASIVDLAKARKGR